MSEYSPAWSEEVCRENGIGVGHPNHLSYADNYTADGVLLSNPDAYRYKLKWKDDGKDGQIDIVPKTAAEIAADGLQDLATSHPRLVVPERGAA